MSEYTETITSLSRASGVCISTLKAYCAKRQLDFILDASGRYLLRQGQVDRVKEILRYNRSKQGLNLPRGRRRQAVAS